MTSKFIQVSSSKIPWQVGMWDDAKSRHDVVLQLMEGLHGMGHVVYIDNFFTSIQLLMGQHVRGTYGIEMV